GGAEAELAGDARDLRRHTLILGLGRVGRTVVQLLEATDREYLALDRDPEAVAEGRARGTSVYYGDGSNPEVLRSAGVGRASVVVITLDDTASALRALHAIRAEDHDGPVIGRARDTAAHDALREAGATAVVPELVEGSLQLGGRLLLALGEAEDAVEAALDEMRRDNYQRLADTGGRDHAAAAATRESE
ncbi:MAG TPA: NAD(P)-binding protein, partial [Longimicrobium sp.]|nr:NAD(P)-binding protein [Longimicrobium sp.]